MLPRTWSRSYSRGKSISVLRRTYSTKLNSGTVIYEDKALLVLNKPAGFNSQLRGGKPDVLDLLGSYTDPRNERSNVWVCHRLDKLTTGALICAKTPSAAKELNQQFRQRVIDKTYLALVLNTQIVRDAGTISEPLVQTEQGMFLWEEHSGLDQIEATTDYAVLAKSPVAPVSLLRFEPTTGRKHQLRVHSANVLKAPILGDNRHTKMRDARIAQKLGIPPSIMFLHSSHISCFRYRRGKPRFRLGITAPLQRHFIELCNQLQVPVPEQYVRGGVYIDGERVEDGVVEDLGGRWLL